MVAAVNTGELHISDTFRLPLDTVVETLVILARRGRGKTNTAVVMAEELIALGQPVLIVDPLGVWWGLRAGADGTRAGGLPVVIFGGDHADLPLSERAGGQLAQLIVEGRFPAILDLSDLSKSAGRRFMAGFLEELYRINREPLHLIIDEADEFAPQRAAAEGARLLGAMNDVQRRGRARGLGTTLISQRPAVLHKDLLSQAEVLVCLGMTSPRDIAAVDEWIRSHADEEQARELRASLPSLPVGTAWIWSPSWLQVLQQVRIRSRRTFDSSATPRPGLPRPSATTFADVDLASLQQRLGPPSESVPSDPAELRALVARLERELSVERSKPVPPPVRVEVPVLSDQDRILLSSVAGTLSEILHRVVDTPPASPQRISMGRLDEQAAMMMWGLPDPQPSDVESTSPAGAARRGRRTTASRRPPESTAPSDTASGSLPKAQRLIVSALALHGPLNPVQIAVLTGYRSTSGGFRNALSNLRSAGLIEGRGVLTLTAAVSTEGLDPLPAPGPDLIEWWKRHHLNKAERAIIDALVEAAPNPLPNDEIAARTGYSATSGGFRNALSRLRTMQLAEGRGQLSLSPTVYPS